MVRCRLEPRKHILKPFSLTEHSEIQLDSQASMAQHMVFEQKIDGSCGDIQQFRNMAFRTHDYPDYQAQGAPALSQNQGALEAMARSYLVDRSLQLIAVG
jgi:hypothetical protein